MSISNDNVRALELMNDEVGNAKVAGLTEDLNMHGLQYNTAVTLFLYVFRYRTLSVNAVLTALI